jgi:hypothetical protein
MLVKHFVFVFDIMSSVLRIGTVVERRVFNTFIHDH